MEERLLVHTRPPEDAFHGIWRRGFVEKKRKLSKTLIKQGFTPLLYCCSSKVLFIKFCLPWLKIKFLFIISQVIHRFSKLKKIGFV